ncbi:ATP-dependent DNA helicase [Yunchengibacter salinarum]|uniref:ATP-dependent DNA helicase n=1 Tax=Yunchengibacter salinarum TaxID=3133399 RepID=UPI0035B69F0F
MRDLIVEAAAEDADLSLLPVMDVTIGGATRLAGDGTLETLSLNAAADAMAEGPHLCVHRLRTGRLLGLNALVAHDVLELFAFARPARPALPTLKGLAEALTLDASLETGAERCGAIRTLAARLLADMASETYRYHAGARDVAVMMAQAGWPWGPLVIQALDRRAGNRDGQGENGLATWLRVPEWQDDAPPPPPGDAPVAPEDAQNRLARILGSGSEERPGQHRYAGAATHAFRPREMADGPNMQLLEAGTGTGKTLGYIAPASLWAEANDAPVWLATYTKNLQRQLDQELSRLYPDPRTKAARAVIRKGRENYACLLNLEETTRAVFQRARVESGLDRDRVLVGLVLRWARFTRDGDMIGGDFPAWLKGPFGVNRISGLTDRRGECLYAACPHYRRCFIERAARKTRHADLVVANHALVMAQAATRPDGDPDLPLRLVFDEGHHLFDAADSAFAVALSGSEGAELRRWLRGKESGGTTRARGLKNRLEELVSGDQEAVTLLEQVMAEARQLPADNWLSRLAGGAPITAYETFLTHARGHILARARDAGPYSLEAALTDPAPALVESADQLRRKLHPLGRALTALSARLKGLMDEQADTLDSSDRGRLEAAARSLTQRAELVRQWCHMLQTIGPDDAADGTVQGDGPAMVDYLELDRIAGKDRDVGLFRHYVDPTEPLARTVFDKAHGVLVTSATLRDRVDGAALEQEEADPPRSEMDQAHMARPQAHRAASREASGWGAADSRTGAQHLLSPARRLSVPSPFDYARQTEVIIVGDVNKQDPDQVAAAYRALFMASGGGALGLFTAISRLKATWNAIAPDLEARGLPLLAQHVDPMDTATLVDIFRLEEDACLLGTDAVRDGVDVPGRALRQIVFDRVPWPRPTLLHRARRAAFGGRGYDEMLTRLKLAQAFGRLIRRADDRGVFVLLDGRTPTRLLDGLPAGVPVHRLGLRDAVARVAAFHDPGSGHSVSSGG